MRNMAKMRLQNQVEELSERMNKKASVTIPPIPVASPTDPNLNFSPYIVIDTFCLIGSTAVVRRLFESHQYVVVVPRKGECNFKC